MLNGHLDGASQVRRLIGRWKDVTKSLHYSKRKYGVLFRHPDYQEYCNGYRGYSDKETADQLTRVASSTHSYVQNALRLTGIHYPIQK